MTLNSIKRVYFVSGVYDLALGVVFGMLFKPIYLRLGITLPNHDAFIQFPAALVAIFGIGFLMVSRDPPSHVGIMKMGVMLKLAYVLIVGGHWLLGSMPMLYVPFVFIDALFLLLFIRSVASVSRRHEFD